MHERFLDKEEIPSEKQIFKALGPLVKPEWQGLIDYISAAYDSSPDLIYGGKNYGWMYKFRKAGKTLCTMFPEKKSFSVVVVFGVTDLENVRNDFKKLTRTTQKIINDTRQYHDGKWVKYSIPEDGGIDQIKIMLKAKRQPKIAI
jgi:hypothetical protein